MFLKYASAPSEQEEDTSRTPPSPAYLPLEISAPSLSPRSNCMSPSLSPPLSTPSHSSAPQLSIDTAQITPKGLTSFLLSPDNTAFADQHGKIVQDMTRPLPEYYISSSHNTYLIGHQLVGESTVEGYIRALLHSCRSVESKYIHSLYGCMPFSSFFQLTFTMVMWSP